MNPFHNIRFSFEPAEIKTSEIIPSFYYQWIDKSEDYFLKIDLLKNSIEKMGLLVPPLIGKSQKDINKYFLISGLKRIESLKLLKIDCIKCNLISQPLSDLELFLIFIFDNISQKTFGPLEIAEFLNYLKTQIEEKIIISDFLPIFMIQPSKEELDKYIIISSLSKEEKMALRDKILDHKVANNLICLKNNDRKTILDLFIKIKPSVSHQRIILELLDEISRRDEKTFLEILSTDKINKIIHNEKISPQQKSYHIKKYLESLRNPIIAKTIEKFYITLKSMKLPKNIIIQHSEYFEDENFILTAKFKNKNELKNIAEILLKNYDKFNFDLNEK